MNVGRHTHVKDTGLKGLNSGCQAWRYIPYQLSHLVSPFCFSFLSVALGVKPKALHNLSKLYHHEDLSLTLLTFYFKTGFHEVSLKSLCGPGSHELACLLPQPPQYSGMQLADYQVQQPGSHFQV